ncbi:MAG TPA: hypothetical protein VJW23_10150 [Propionibacteriaceae bacterium]|nr:hypothetical protein [Propionibacteriaceae bacterium]
MPLAFAGVHRGRGIAVFVVWDGALGLAPTATVCAEDAEVVVLEDGLEVGLLNLLHWTPR